MNIHLLFRNFIGTFIHFNGHPMGAGEFEEFCRNKLTRTKQIVYTSNFKVNYFILMYNGIMLDFETNIFTCKLIFLNATQIKLSYTIYFIFSIIFIIINKVSLPHFQYHLFLYYIYIFLFR